MSTALIIKAMHFAAHKHRDQRRKDEVTPYINHPIEVMAILAIEGGIDDPHILAAALLHDTLEDTETTIDELRTEFGDDVTSIVLEVTEDQNLPRPERYALQKQKVAHYSNGAKLIKLADKITNLRDAIASPPVKWTPARLQAHYDHAIDLVALLRGTHDELEKLFDQAYAQRSK